MFCLELELWMDASCVWMLETEPPSPFQEQVLLTTVPFLPSFTFFCLK